MITFLNNVYLNFARKPNLTLNYFQYLKLKNKQSFIARNLEKKYYSHTYA